MMKILTLALLALIAIRAEACPELEGVDFASSYGSEKYEVVTESVEIKLTREEVKSMPYIYENWTRCQDALAYTVVKATETGRLFYTILTRKDECDGGNSVGGLFLDGELVSGIDDSSVSCTKPSRSFKSLGL